MATRTSDQPLWSGSVKVEGQVRSLTFLWRPPSSYQTDTSELYWSRTPEHTHCGFVLNVYTLLWCTVGIKVIMLHFFVMSFWIIELCVLCHSRLPTWLVWSDSTWLQSTTDHTIGHMLTLYGTVYQQRHTWPSWILLLSNVGVSLVLLLVVKLCSFRPLGSCPVVYIHVARS